MSDLEPLQRVMVEACVDSIECALASERAGAGRVELCGPGVGGTTPSYGLMSRCRERLRIPMHVMIRPREGNFEYNEDEFETMIKDVHAARSARADGVVFGILRRDGTLDEDRMRALVDAARPMRVACHRAFDATPDAAEALQTLLRLGVDLVLTSGHAPSAVDGRAQLKSHCDHSNSTLTIMAGGGVRAANLIETIRETGVHEVHIRATDPDVFVEAMIQLGRCSPEPLS
ncbi:MAG: copper homeostasis protein CutC [Gemmatimonadaceae bacterium]